MKGVGEGRREGRREVKEKKNDGGDLVQGICGNQFCLCSKSEQVGRMPGRKGREGVRKKRGICVKKGLTEVRKQ
jgi:hypothetical protein